MLTCTTRQLTSHSAKPLIQGYLYSSQNPALLVTSGLPSQLVVVTRNKGSGSFARVWAGGGFSELYDWMSALVPNPIVLFILDKVSR